ncbi:MAG: hypothetical protein FWH27_13865 [Planctomycetaceae bacterium]|nr:hypothetical protein [Planctomycetaceae bacterium]
MSIMHKQGKITNANQCLFRGISSILSRVGGDIILISFIEVMVVEKQIPWEQSIGQIANCGNTSTFFCGSMIQQQQETSVSGFLQEKIIRLIRKLKETLLKLPMLSLFGKIGNFISGFSNKSIDSTGFMCLGLKIKNTHMLYAKNRKTAQNTHKKYD